MTTLDKPIRLTPEDLLRMPDASGMELVDGQIVEKRVSIQSSETELKIAHILAAFLDKSPIARVFPSSLGYRCFPANRERIRKPDVSVVLMERMKLLTEWDAGFMPITPDLAVEVVSTHDTVYELDEKLREYQEAEFQLIWIADPAARNVTVYPRDGKPFILTGDDEIRADGVLPGFTCKVSQFFPIAR